MPTPRTAGWFGLLAAASLTAVATSAVAQSPNILFILADDLGYSDIGAFGGEIRTPNLDALANAGMKLTQFHASPVCNVTRAELLTGLDNRVAVDPNGATAASRTALRSDVPTIAEALGALGYRTYMTGKWDAGQREDQTPAARGFDRSFAMLPGTASHFDEPQLASRQPIYHDGQAALTELPENYYSTRTFTDELLGFLEEDKESDKPFFAYLAYTAPHFPLQVPEPYVDRYDGVYDAGYDAIRATRLERMKLMGLIAPDFVDSPIPADAIAWKSWPSAQEHAWESRRMQVYAGMVDYMDEQIGRVVDYLASSGQLDDTLIVFTSDNGAAPGWNPPVFVDYGGGAPDNSADNLGKPGSYFGQGTGWAWVSNAPFKRYKETAEEGGHSVPAIAFLPGVIPAGAISDSFMTVRDMLPTFLDIAGATSPATNAAGDPSIPPQGRSVLPVLKGATDDAVHAGEPIAFDTGNAQYMFDDNWKILMGPDSQWELYDLSADRGEQNDLAEANPDELQRMIAEWDAYNGRIAGDILTKQ